MQQLKFVSGLSVHGVKAPAKINFDAGVCDSQSTQYVGVFGEFGSRRLSSKKPVVKLVIDKENVPFKWTFHMGGVNGDSDTHSFTIGKFKSNYIKWTVQCVNGDIPCFIKGMKSWF